LQECRRCGTEQLELHAAVPDAESIFSEWKMINEIIDDNYVSMCLDRLHLGDSYLRHRIKKAQAIAGERFIVQADGVPMSGGSDDYNTTLQAVAIADIVMKSKKTKIRFRKSGLTWRDKLFEDAKPEFTITHWMLSPALPKVEAENE